MYFNMAFLSPILIIACYLLLLLIDITENIFPQIENTEYILKSKINYVTQKSCFSWLSKYF